MDFKKLTEEMGNHSLRDYPNECVGIITLKGEYVPSKNISPAPRTTFYLDPETLLEYDGNIWGIFHSHPGETNPLPSQDDKVSAAFNKFKYIVGFGNKFYIYWLDKNVNALKFEPLKEKHFEDIH